VPTCNSQSSCYKASIKPVSPQCDHQCSFQVCVKVDINRPGCAKILRGIKHVCQPRDNSTTNCLGTDVVPNLKNNNVRKLTLGGSNCFVMEGGSTLQFVLNDGKRCKRLSTGRTVVAATSTTCGFKRNCNPRTNVSFAAILHHFLLYYFLLIIMIILHKNRRKNFVRGLVMLGKTAYGASRFRRALLVARTIN
jgi:hypothetical protein